MAYKETILNKQEFKKLNLVYKLHDLHFQFGLKCIKGIKCAIIFLLALTPISCFHLVDLSVDDKVRPEKKLKEMNVLESLQHFGCNQTKWSTLL